MHPLAARADGDPVSDAYTYGASNCDTSTRTDPVTLIFHGAAFNDPNRTRSPIEIVQDIETDAFPISGAIAGGTQYAHNGSGCSTQLWSFGREFGPQRTVQGTTFSHREKKHVRFFNTRDSAPNSRCRAARTAKERPPAILPRSRETPFTSATTGRAASTLRLKSRRRCCGARGMTSCDTQRSAWCRRPSPSANGFVVPWSGNVYRVNVP